jgi:catechol 2,3-dioxygenase-like lactoylglutathione lyase family enzyme
MKPTLEAVHPVLMVRDVGRAIRFYAGLGFASPWCDDPSAPRYAVIRRDQAELHLQWHDAAEWAGPGDRPTYRFPVRDVDGLHAEFAGRVPPEDVAAVWDTSWGTREFHVRDPDGNGLQFYWPR